MESRRVFFRGSMFFGFFNPETLGKMKPKLTYLCIIWVFPKIGVPQNGWSLRKTLLELMIWGYPYFWKHPYVFRWVGSTKTTNSGYCKIQITSLHQKVPKVPRRREDPGSSGRWSPVFEWEKSCELWVGLFLKKQNGTKKRKAWETFLKHKKMGSSFFFLRKAKEIQIVFLLQVYYLQKVGWRLFISRRWRSRPPNGGWVFGPPTSPKRSRIPAANFLLYERKKPGNLYTPTFESFRCWYMITFSLEN